jgi:uncharacterized membrane protein
MKTTMMTRTFAALAAVGALFAAMLMLAGGANAASVAPPPGGGTGGVHITNPSPQPGGTVTVSGQNCDVNSPVTVSFDGTQIGSGTTDGSGNYSITVTIPSDASPGHHTITVTGASCSGTLGIEVVAPSSANGGGSLAGTGVAVVGIGALGVVLLVGGGMMLLAGRRRSHV